MKNLRTLLVIAIAIFGFTTASFGQGANGATVTGVTASSRIITAISLTKQNGQDLIFGDVITGVVAGSVTMNTLAARVAAGGVTLGNVATASTAKFDVAGEANSTYLITLPASSVTISYLTNDMTVDNFKSDPGLDGTESLTGTLVGGADHFSVGARLNVGANQPAGLYSGTFDVIVNYN